MTKEQKAEELRKIVHDIRLGKETRELALRQLRPLERELGWGETYPAGYNKKPVKEGIDVCSD